MRRQMIVTLAFLLALGADPVAAYFALSPGEVFGLVTLPMREMLGHLGGHRRGHTREAKPAAKAAHGPDGAAAETTPQPTAAPGVSRLNAYDSVLGYAFWPDDYAAEFNRYGYGDIAAAVGGPAANGNATTGSNSGSDAGSPMLCRNADASTADWLTGQIEKDLRPDAAQLRSFDALRGELAKGAETIRTSCAVVTATSPTTRLAALAQRLWAVHDAAVLARHSLQAFYATLTPDQKAKFNNTVQASAAPQDREDCTARAGTSARLIEQIERAVQPTRDQAASLEALQKTATQMEQMLAASCAQPPGKDPLARLDAAEQRLVMLNYAATSMEIALNDFYSSLDSGQKAKFQSLGR